MRTITFAVLVCSSLAFGGCTESHNKPDNMVTLSDGSTLEIVTHYRGAEPQENGVDAFLCSKDGTVVWYFQATSVLFTPGSDSYIALVKVLEDRIFIYFAWNRQHCTIDKKTGRILAKGKGDDAIKQYKNLVPLRLTAVNDRSIGMPIKTGEERRKWFANYLKTRRRDPTITRSQAIPKSKLENRYVIHFDTNRDGRPGPDWHPLFVIVWKAENFQSIYCGSPAIGINGHSIRPPHRNAIYALQTNYSLQELPFTKEEIARLFSHITSSEKRTDEHMASLVDLIERRDPHWDADISAEMVEEERFPPDRYWKQNVDPYVKIVEPNRKKTE